MVFIFNTNWLDILSHFSSDLRDRVLNAVYSFVAHGDEPADLDPMAQLAFLFIRDEIVQNQRIYDLDAAHRAYLRRQKAEAKQKSQVEHVADVAVSSDVVPQPVEESVHEPVKETAVDKEAVAEPVGEVVPDIESAAAAPLVDVPDRDARTKPVKMKKRRPSPNPADVFSKKFSEVLHRKIRVR